MNPQELLWQALGKRDEAKARFGGGLGFDADRLASGEYMARWLEGPLKRSVATNTHEDYLTGPRKYLIPAPGDIKLNVLPANWAV
jgi:hypothetical protein